MNVMREINSISDDDDDDADDNDDNDDNVGVQQQENEQKWNI